MIHLLEHCGHLIEQDKPFFLERFDALVRCRIKARLDPVYLVIERMMAIGERIEMRAARFQAVQGGGGCGEFIMKLVRNMGHRIS
jgi:hypothetical protein